MARKDIKDAVAAATVEEDKPDAEIIAKEPAVEIVDNPTPATAKIDGIDELKRQLDAEKAARIADKERADRAERERNAAMQQSYQARNAQDDAESRLFDGAVAQLKSNTQVLKQDLKAAWAAGDLDRAADIQEMIADNAAKINSIEAGKQAVKERVKEPPRPLDPVEAFAQRLSPKSAAWVRAHPEYATDQRLNTKMIAAHQMALADGHEADTPGYFEAVEESLKIAPQQSRGRTVQSFIETPDDEPALSSASAPTQRRQSPAAAPVSRDPVSSSGERRGGQIRLTKDEYEVARLTGQTPQQYYNNKMRDLN